MMKALITQAGEMIVAAEDETEAWALEQWYQRTEACKINFGRNDDGDAAQTYIVILNTAQQIEEDDEASEQREGVEE